ncbi:hypothetical protein C8F04DRAFT_137850 [Mycena alexandri]|uniref:Uncharacterized protein n=1 Tax=Mycena alexandri TaxID=1745969 RepID=A0AAD6SEQ5_9AGAR|nr:hypothetical protein C8F04DRAFT_137850 [Mycena alexandri]
MEPLVKVLGNHAEQLKHLKMLDDPKRDQKRGKSFGLSPDPRNTDNQRSEYGTDLKDCSLNSNRTLRSSSQPPASSFGPAPSHPFAIEREGVCSRACRVEVEPADLCRLASTWSCRWLNWLTHIFTAYYYPQFLMPVVLVILFLFLSVVEKSRQIPMTPALMALCRKRQ